MTFRPDPFSHHPELRGLIRAPETSYFRDFDPAELERTLAEQGTAPGWRTPDDARESARRGFLGDHFEGDLWVFAYGSLMWDPAFRFIDVRRAALSGYHRSFCVVDTLGGRGTPEAPGLMAALDRGGQCDGLAFHIAAEDVSAETEILWRREMLAPAYAPTHVTVNLSDTSLRCVAFVADHAAPMIQKDIDRETQIRMLATGTGFLGSSLAYIDNLLIHLDALKITDPDLVALRDAARDLALQAG